MNEKLNERLAEIREKAKENNLVQRLHEVNDHLGPLLEQLGVMAEVWETEFAARIRFLPLDDDGWYSPVEIIFNDTNGREPTWQDAYLKVGIFGCRALGETGFVSWKRFDVQRQELRGEDDAKMFEWLSFVMGYHRTVPPCFNVPNCIVNDNFGDLYEDVARWAEDLEILQIYGPNDKAPLEVFKFKDRRGRDVEISMRWLSGERAKVHVDGRFEAEFYDTDRFKFYEILRKLCDKNFSPRIYRR